MGVQIWLFLIFVFQMTAFFSIYAFHQFPFYRLSRQKSYAISRVLNPLKIEHRSNFVSKRSFQFSINQIKKINSKNCSTNSALEQHQNYLIRRQDDSAANYVITGGNRGIGLQFVKSLLELSKGTVIACCRHPSPALAELSSMYGPERLKVYSGLNIERQHDIECFKDFIESGCNSRVDILFNVVGILHDMNEAVTKSKPPERALNQVDRLWLEKSFSSNTIGPVMLMLIQALEPFLIVKKSQLYSQEKDQISGKNSRFPSIVVNLSARVGSISDNSLGGWLSYRMTKAALNMATKTISIEYRRKNIHVISIHPGTTDTDLSKPFQKNVKKEKLFTPEYSVLKMLDVVFNNVDEDTTGSFFAYDGSKIQW